MRDENVAIELLYRGGSVRSTPLEATADIRLFVEHADLLDVDPPQLLSNDAFGADKWRLPAEYLELDVEVYVWSLVPNDAAARDRVRLELDEYRARNLMPVLRALIYIVDVLKKNSIVWGVGRGSSVASYVLYLIGVHRINSLSYNLDIREFFK